MSPGRQHDRPTHIDDQIASGDFRGALASLALLWHETAGPGVAGFVNSRFERLKEHVNPAPCRIAILRSFTVEPLIPLVRAAAATHGIDVTAHTGDFNTYAQDILDPASSLYRFAPDMVFLAVQTRDLCPMLWDGFAELSPAQSAEAADRTVESFRVWIETFRSRSAAHLVIHTLETPPVPANGILDAQSANGQIETILRINQALRQLASGSRGVYLLDYDGLIARHGRFAWYDPYKWLTLRMPISAQAIVPLAQEWLRFIYPLSGKSCKALAIDLDNTLWGGVIGEDGVSGIKIGPEHPGAVYLDVQRAILDLYHRGVILAICSKNDESDAMAAIEQRPGMLLRRRHFGAWRINWNDKAQNLREIAAELNIGVDAIAFLDDNPAEREWIRRQLPEATVIELPAAALGYARALRESPVFERLTLTAEDRERGRYYAEQRLRQPPTGASLEEFYSSLAMEVEIATVTPETLPRVAQLTQKTNQFNLTTRRYSEQQIAEFAARPAWRVYALHVRDTFGDHGLVGVALTHSSGDTCEIDTFLLSCRVIGRTVETGFLAALAEQALADGQRRLVGFFVPTKKNLPAKDFYASHGFTCIDDGEGESRWEFDLTQGQIQDPAWIRRRVLCA